MYTVMHRAAQDIADGNWGFAARQESDPTDLLSSLMHALSVMLQSSSLNVRAVTNPMKCS